jgi:hypothetical protein
MDITVSWFVVTRMRELKIHSEIHKIFSEDWFVMTDGGYEDEFDDTSIFENKSGLAEVRF